MAMVIGVRFKRAGKVYFFDPGENEIHAGGAVIVEKMFSWPGLGLVTMNAITGRDYPVIMGVCLLSAVVVLAANLLTDIVYALVDPTIQY